MAKAVTLKNSNDEEVYPVTDASLVNGTMATGQIANGAVTAAKIVGGESLTTLSAGAQVEVVGTTTGDNANYALKYSDGRLVCFIRHKFSGNINTAWGSSYTLNRAFPLTNYAVPFISEPMVQATPKVASGQASFWIYIDNSTIGTATTQTPAYAAARATSATNTSGTIEVVAYGFWK